MRVTGLLCVLALSASPCVAAPAVTLPPSVSDQAVTCLAATTILEVQKGYSFPGATKSVYFTLLWSTLGGNSLGADAQKSFQDALSAEAIRIAKAGSQNATEEACVRAYPDSVSDRAVTLPDDADTRLASCVLYGGRAAGIYHGISRKFPMPEVQRYMDFVGLFQAHPAGLNAAGQRLHFSTAAQMDQVVNKAFGLGRPDKVLDACIAAFPPGSSVFG